MRVVLLVAVLLGPLLCEAALNICRNVDGFSLPEDNAYVAYDYTVDAADGTCTSVTRRCSGKVPRDGTSLSQRTWFINPVKDQFGQRYRNRALEIFKIQCPAEHLLHLFPQMLAVQLSATCTTNDFVTVERGEDSDDILCGTNIQGVPFYNNGQGVLVETGNATITFCTDEASNVNNFGFVIRATCLDPRRLQFQGCVDFQESLNDDADFADLRRRTLVQPDKVEQPHKRSIVERSIFDYVSLMRRRVHSERLKAFRSKSLLRAVTRNKRFAFFERQSLTDVQCATYENNILTLDFKDGTTRSYTVASVVLDTPLIGTRLFCEDAKNMIFDGPADVEVSGTTAIIKQQGDPDINALFLPSPVAAEIVNIIADYVYECYVRPYPITDESGRINTTVPLRGADGPGNFVRFSDILLVREGVDESDTCRIAAVEQIAPVRGSETDRFLNTYCRFFEFACDPYLSAICDQVVDLDTIPRGK